MRLSPSGSVLVVGCLGSLVLLGPDVGAATQSVQQEDFALAAGAELALLAFSGWITVCCALAALGTRARWSAAVARALTPGFLRRALFLGAAGALALAPVAAHGAANRAPAGGADTTISESLNGLRLPDRPSTPPARSITDPASVRVAPVIVQPGDSLWSIAAQHLGGTASTQAIAVATGRWYASNRARIGPDPDVIFPGQQLTPPTKDSP